MARFEGISIPNENLTGNRLDANVGGKYWQKTTPKMAKLASFLLKSDIPRPLTDFRTFVVARFEGITILNKNLMGNRLDVNAKGKY